jgi:hypothetical protein
MVPSKMKSITRITYAWRRIPVSPIANIRHRNVMPVAELREAVAKARAG